MELVRQLYQVVTTKQLFLEWLLEVNMFFGRKLLRALAIEEVNEYTEANEVLDMKTVSNGLKRHYP